MEFQQVPVASIIGMVVSLVVSFALPVALCIAGVKKFKANLSSFFIGGAVFVVFALILERIFHSIVLGGTGGAIKDNILLYALYGGLVAAAFEESGRYLAMKFLMKKNLNLSNGFMYGIGHGGFEAMLILGITSISNIATSVMINTGLMPATLQMLDENTLATTMEQLSALWTTPAYAFYLGGVERVFAIVLQIAMSLIMYVAVKNGKKNYIALAVGIHFFADALSVIAASKLPIWGVEIIVAVLAIASMAVAHRIVVNNPD